jgi:hypothetical protein
MAAFDFSKFILTFLELYKDFNFINFVTIAAIIRNSLTMN